MTAKDWSCPMYGFNVPYGDLELVTGMEKFLTSFSFLKQLEDIFDTLVVLVLVLFFYGKQGSPRGRTVACCVFKIRAVRSGTGG
jgi:hypothetical protein